jgi:hypothetical protein
MGRGAVGDRWRRGEVGTVMQGGNDATSIGARGQELRERPSSMNLDVYHIRSKRKAFQFEP